MKMNSLCWLPTFYVQKQATLIKFFNKQTPINCWMPYTAFARNMMERSWNIACIKWHAHIQSWINSLKLNHHEISESQCFKALIKIEQTNKQTKNKKMCWSTHARNCDCQLFETVQNRAHLTETHSVILLQIVFVMINPLGYLYYQRT